MKTLLGVFISVAHVGAWAQAPKSTGQSKQEAYERMHLKLREALINGGDPAQTMRMIEESMHELTAASSSSPPVAHEWSPATGGLQLTITPSHPEARLEVDVKEGRISLRETGVVASVIELPRGCDGDKVKTSGKDGKLVLIFPCEGSEVGANRPAKAKKEQ